MKKRLIKNSIIALVLIFINMCMLGINLSTHTIYASSSKNYAPYKGMCVMEKTTKKVLYNYDEHRQLANASTTKIVTAITAIQNCDDLQEEIVVDDLAIGVEGTSIYLKKGEKIKVIDLLYGLMLRSGNDSAAALACHVGGTYENFIDMMNKTAEIAGAKNSHFANPHGLDNPEHYTTAYDLALITCYALNNPIFKEIVSTKQYKIEATNVGETRYLNNKNKLLSSLDGCTGVKTGFTSKAGRCLVSSCERNGMEVVCVVLNCGPMFEESKQFLNNAFVDYTYACVVDKDKPIYNEYYLNDTKGQLNLVADESFYIPLNNYETEDVTIQYTLNEFSGDIDEGEEVGEINVFVDKHLQKTIKLYTINKIDVLNNFDALKSIQLQWEEKYEIK